MEQILLYREDTRPKRRCTRQDSKFYKFNRIMHHIFAILAVFSFILMIGVNEHVDDFWKPLILTFSSFFICVMFAWYFDFPARARYTIRLRIYNALVALDTFFEERKYKRKVKRLIENATRYDMYTWKEMYDMIRRSCR